MLVSNALMMRLCTLVLLSGLHSFQARVHQVYVKLGEIKPELNIPSNDLPSELHLRAQRTDEISSINLSPAFCMDLQPIYAHPPIEDLVPTKSVIAITPITIVDDLEIQVEGDETLAPPAVQIDRSGPYENVDHEKLIIYTTEMSRPLSQEISQWLSLLLLSIIVVSLIYLKEHFSNAEKNSRKKRISNTTKLNKESILTDTAQSEILEETKALIVMMNDSGNQTDFDDIIPVECSEEKEEKDYQEKILKDPNVISLHDDIATLNLMKMKLEENATVSDRKYSSLIYTNNALNTSKNNEINTKQIEINELRTKLMLVSENLTVTQNNMELMKEEGTLSKKNLKIKDIASENLSKKIEEIKTEKIDEKKKDLAEISRLKNLVVELNNEIHKIALDKDQTEIMFSNADNTLQTVMKENGNLTEKINNLEIEKREILLIEKSKAHVEEEKMKIKEREIKDLVESIRILKEKNDEIQNNQQRIILEKSNELENIKFDHNMLQSRLMKLEEENNRNRKFIENSERETHLERHKEDSSSVRGSFSTVRTDSSSTLSWSNKESSPSESPKNVPSTDTDPTGDKTYKSAMTSIKEKLACDLEVAIKEKENAESNARLYRNECSDLKKEVSSVKKVLTDYKAEIEEEKNNEDSLKKLNDESAKQRSTLIAHMELHNNTLLSQIIFRDKQINSFESQILELNSKSDVLTSEVTRSESEIEKLRNDIEVLNAEKQKLRQDSVRTPGKNIMSVKKVQLDAENSNFSPVDLFSQRTSISFHPTSAFSPLCSPSPSNSNSGSSSGSTSVDTRCSSSSHTSTRTSVSTGDRNSGHGHGLSLSFDSPSTTVESVGSSGNSFFHFPCDLYCNLFS